MTFIYPVNVTEEVDIDKIKEEWNNNPSLINLQKAVFSYGEYALLNFIVNEGLDDLRAQEPELHESDEETKLCL